MAAEPVFIDTNVLIAATVETHPSHATAVALLARLIADQAPLAISTQICREFLAVVTRQPVEGRTFSGDEALAALARWRSSCAVLDDDKAVLAELLDLVRRHDVKGKQVHDANVVGDDAGQRHRAPRDLQRRRLPAVRGRNPIEPGVS